MVGYRRFEGLEAAKLLSELYRSARLFVNFFQPSFKLMTKQRDGARVRKTYSAAATPHQRLVADARTPDAARHHLQGIYAALDPVALLRDIRGAQDASRRSRIPSQLPILLQHRNRSISSWQACEPPGRTEPCGHGSANCESEKRPASS